MDYNKINLEKKFSFWNKNVSLKNDLKNSICVGGECGACSSCSFYDIIANKDK